MEAPRPINEGARLGALERYRILDTPQESDFDELVQLAAQICGTPIALVSLVDRDRQWFKGRYGLEVAETPRRLSFCAHSILQAPALTEVPDARQDARFADNELVTGTPGIRFYAAVPLVSREKHALGTLCVIDTKPRQLTEQQKAALRVLSRQVMTQLELRRNLAELKQAAEQLAAAHAQESSRLEALVRERTAALARANEELRQKEERFRTLAEASFEGIFFHQQGRIVDCNEQLGAILGWTRKELLGRHVTEFLPPEEHEPALRPTREHQEATLDLRARRKDGSWRVIEVHGRELGEAGLRVATVRDVTERRQMVQALRQSEERLRLFIERAPAAIAMFDREMRYLAASRRWQEQYAPGEPHLGGKCHYELWPDMPERWKQAHRRGLAGEIVTCPEDAYEGRDGVLRWAKWEVRPWPGPQGQVGGIIVMTEDITARKLLEAELRQSEERFRTMANAMPQLASIGRPDGFIFWYNQRWYEYTGTTPKQMEGWGWQQVHDPQMLPQVLEQWRVSIATGQPFEMELPLRGADGRFRPFLTRVTPLKDAAGEVLFWFGTNTDITEIVVAREALARSRAELECLVQERTAQLVEANANLQNFAYTAAHDLRSPLRSISTFTSLVLAQSGEKLDGMGRSMLERVVESAGQMGRLLADLLEYSKIPQSELRLELVKLEGAVREALRLLEADIRTKQAEVSVEPNLPDVVGNPATVIMVVSNLVSNGLKFMEPGATPRLRIWAEQRPMAAPGQGRFVRLWVEDNGIGITPEDQAKLFSAFARLHGREAYPGTGLGLAIVRKGAERMGGRVGVESELGKGSRFWVELRSAEPSG